MFEKINYVGLMININMIKKKTKNNSFQNNKKPLYFKTYLFVNLYIFKRNLDIYKKYIKRHINIT